jgi:SAM-dependent methyltransferase
MLSDFFTVFFRIFPRLKSIMWREAYQFLSRVYTKTDWKFMNYGYTSLDGSDGIAVLDRPDEENRFCIQLYHYLASAVDLRGLRVLEVGSGRGGGADYLHRYLTPKTMVGVDFSKNAVAFCNQSYPLNGLAFKAGNAEALPFGNDRFDAVINVESSHCYNSMGGFLEQVKRVLSPGGHFLFADFRGRDDLGALKAHIRASGLAVVKEIDISANVLEALRQDSERKTREINTKIAEALGLADNSPATGVKARLHGLIVTLILEFTGAKDSTIYKELQTGDTIYMSYVLQKQKQTAPLRRE